MPASKSRPRFPAGAFFVPAVRQPKGRSTSCSPVVLSRGVIHVYDRSTAARSRARSACYASSAFYRFDRPVGGSCPRRARRGNFHGTVRHCRRYRLAAARRCDPHHGYGDRDGPPGHVAHSVHHRGFDEPSAVSISPQPRRPGRHKHSGPAGAGCVSCSWSYVTGTTYDQEQGPSALPAAHTGRPRALPDSHAWRGLGVAAVSATSRKPGVARGGSCAGGAHCSVAWRSGHLARACW